MLTDLQKPGQWAMRVGQRLNNGKRIYTTLFLDVLKSGSFKIVVKDVADGRRHVGMYIFQWLSRERESLGISIFCVRLLHVCSFYYDGHMPEPQNVERAAEWVSRFLFYPPLTTSPHEAIYAIPMHYSGIGHLSKLFEKRFRI